MTKKTTRTLAATFFKSLKAGAPFRLNNDWETAVAVKLSHDVMGFESFLRANAVDTVTGVPFFLKDSSDVYVEEI